MKACWCILAGTEHCKHCSNRPYDIGIQEPFQKTYVSFFEKRDVDYKLTKRISKRRVSKKGYYPF